MTPDQQEQYLKWLEDRININDELMTRENMKVEPDQSYYGAWGAFESAKEKFLSLTQPQSINNDIPDNNVRL